MEKIDTTSVGLTDEDWIDCKLKIISLEKKLPMKVEKDLLTCVKNIT